MSCFLVLIENSDLQYDSQKAAHKYMRLIQYEHYEVQTKSKEKNS